MGLCNVYSWQMNKTVKLSDSYQVLLRLNAEDYKIVGNQQLDDPYIELYDCISVGLPSYKYKEEIYQYGNNAKKFLIPDYESGLEDLTLEFNEHYGNKFVNNENVQCLAINELVSLCLSKLFDIKTFAYKLDDYIQEIKVRIFDNRFSKIAMEYVFNNLKLTNYEKYDLDYSSSEIARWKLSFSYQSYKMDTIEIEPIKYENLPDVQGQVNTETIDNVNVEGQGIDTNINSGIEQDLQEQYNATVKNREEELKGNQRGVSTLADDIVTEENKLKELKSQKKNVPGLDKEQKILEESKEKVKLAEEAVEQAKAEKKKSELEHQESINAHGRALKKLDDKDYSDVGPGTKARVEEHENRIKAVDSAVKNRAITKNNLDNANNNLIAAEEALKKAKLDEDKAQEAFDKKKQKSSKIIANNEKLDKDIKKTKEKLNELKEQYSEQEAIKRESAIGAEISAKNRSMQEAYTNGNSMPDNNTVDMPQDNTERKTEIPENTTGGDAAAEAAKCAKEAAEKRMADAVKTDEQVKVEKKTKVVSTEDIGQERMSYVRNSDEYQNRVRDISMSLYDPKRNNAQLAYEKAQQQAMEEFLTGKLKVN